MTPATGCGQGQAGQGGACVDPATLSVPYGAPTTLVSAGSWSSASGALTGVPNLALDAPSGNVYLTASGGRVGVWRVQVRAGVAVGTEAMYVSVAGATAGIAVDSVNFYGYVSVGASALVQFTIQLPFPGQGS